MNSVKIKPRKGRSSLAQRGSAGESEKTDSSPGGTAEFLHRLACKGGSEHCSRVGGLFSVIMKIEHYAYRGGNLDNLTVRAEPASPVVDSKNYNIARILIGGEQP